MFRKILICGILAGIVLTLAPADRSDATEFAVNAYRQDPYKQFKFRVKWDGKYVPGVLFVSGLTRTTEVTTNRKGGDPSTFHRSPGQTVYEPIVLERGRTHDTAFETWANKVWNYGSGLGSEASLGDFRKDVVIELYNEAGQMAMAFKIYRCWPSDYSALTGLDANSPEIAIERIVLQHEGWERDYAIAEPTEPTFTEP
ncbi:MAG: phage tail protein [Candidatus Eisenbacteria bacterium]|nr:phage tail protein [Candidatus Eisenbacteria bacterium]